MDADSLAKSLHPLEVRVLLNFTPGTVVSAAILEEKLGYKTGQANQAISWLVAKNALSERARTTHLEYELTDLGTDAAQNGTLEERIFQFLRKNGPHTLPGIAAGVGVDGKDIGSAFGALSKSGTVAMDAEKRAYAVADILPADIEQVATLVRSAFNSPTRSLIVSGDNPMGSGETMNVLQSIGKKRGSGNALFRVAERETVEYEVTEFARTLSAAAKAAGISGEEVNVLTPAMLRDGSWKSKSFRPFNIAVPPARAMLGRRNAYCEFLDHVKDKLVGFGFEEFDGPLVETEFWNSDALFMPQFHSARDIHDVYYVKNPTHAKSIEPRFLEKVAAAHETGGGTGSRGWNYRFDRHFTKRLILRSQGTVMSAKTLADAKIPGKYFGILRCFRYDQVDATHLSDFYQTEGIVLGEDVNLRTLLGLLKMFAEEIAGATEVKYVPGYFPFTEPSVEVHIKHPVLGWFELGGAGIFRPEVTLPMGVQVPVLAWGLGIDRMALMQLGISDLRDLFSPNIEQVRLRREA